MGRDKQVKISRDSLPAFSIISGPVARKGPPRSHRRSPRPTQKCPVNPFGDLSRGPRFRPIIQESVWVVFLTVIGQPRRHQVWIVLILPILRMVLATRFLTAHIWNSSWSS